MRAAFLEAHTEFEGVGAHEFNPRYDQVDDGDHDASIIATPDTMPALFTARSFLTAAVTVPPRFGGADIAHYQHDQAAAAGKAVDWVGLHAGSADDWFASKLTQSVSYLDPTSTRSRQASRGVGFRHVGLYHWLSSTTDPEQQAAFYLSKLGQLADGEFAMLDDEEGGVTVEKTLGWLEYVEARTRRPAAVYSGAYVAAGTIWQDPRITEGKFGPRPKILAAYTTEARARALPGVAANPWSSWQYSSSGPVPGIVGRCDMNRVDDREVYDRAAGLTGSSITAPTPPTAEITSSNPAAAPATEPAKGQDMDSPTFITHSEQIGDKTPRFDFWAMMPDGSRRPATGVEVDVIYADLNVRATAKGLANEHLNQIPIYAPTTVTESVRLGDLEVVSVVTSTVQAK